jgi:dihydroflavonol-4-reductase
MMKALVTGANGFIGSNLVRELLASGHEVRGMVRATSDLRALRGVELPLAWGDVDDPGSLEAAARGCDTLFHVAAVFAYTGYSRPELEQIAVQGTVHALDAAARAGIRRVVLTSSSVVCGSSIDTRPRDERDRLGDDEAAPDYAEVKAEQLRAATAHAQQLGLELVSVLPTMTVGRFDYRLVPSNALIVNYLADPIRATYAGGIDIVSVRDVARGHVLAAERGRSGERYILGGESLEYSLLHRTIAELAGVSPPRVHSTHTSSLLTAIGLELMAAWTRKPPAYTRVQARMLGRFYWYRHDKAQRELGYAPMSARRALADAIGWLAVSPHVPPALRRTLRLSREVYEARRPDLPLYRDMAESPGPVGVDPETDEPREGPR